MLQYNCVAGEVSCRSDQVCLASSDLLHTHLALAGMHFDYYCYCVAGEAEGHIQVCRLWQPRV